ncbi:MAG: hypothetical protein EOP15_23250 [Pseudomonas sp.]|nr:MAG: hypothetical protein EOP15_23250 [Pseudomonas sp.]
MNSLCAARLMGRLVSAPFFGRLHATALCRSGLVSRKARAAGPHFQLRRRYPRARFAGLSRHKAAPTGGLVRPGGSG